MKFQLLYPEQRIVEAEKIIGWANDLAADNNEAPVSNVWDAIDILEDLGEITVGNHGKPLA